MFIFDDYHPKDACYGYSANISKMAASVMFVTNFYTYYYLCAMEEPCINCHFCVVGCGATNQVFRKIPTRY